MTSPSADNDAYNDTALAKQYRTLTGQNLVNFTPGNRYIGTSTGQAGVAVGVSAKAADLATAVGTKSHATGDYSVALGVGANTELANAIALGAGSTTKTNATNVASATVGSVTYGGPAKPFAGSGNVVAGDQVSVGAAGFERQIKHVAPGEITATSTDAINGSQLYQITDGLQKSIANIPSNNTHFYSVQGASGDNNYNNDGAVANKSMAVGNGAKAQGVSSVAIGNATVAKASASNSVSEGAVAIGDTSYAAGHHALALGQSRAEEHNAVAAGSNARAAATSSIAVGTSAVASDAHTIAIGSAANSAAANGIAIGRDSATTMSAPGSVALGYGSQATRRAIVAGSVATSTTPTVAANQVFALDASSDTDKANIRETVKGGSGAVSVGTQNDTRQIINVAAGTEDADAVNVAQLKSVANLIKNNTPTKVGPATGSPVKVENKGSASAPNYELDLTDAAKGSLKKADTAMQTFKVASTPSKGGTATAGSDVANGETLLFKAGDNVSISQSGKEITINATGASSKVEALSGSPITVSGDGSTANPYKVGAATTSLVVGSRGSITAPAAADAGKLVNAGDLAAAINNSGFIATSAKTGSGQVSGSSEKLVKPGDTLKLTAGNGIKIAQQDGEFTISGTDTGSATLPNLKLTGNTGTAETDNIDPAQPYNIKGSDGNILTAVENQGIGFKLADTVKIGPAAGGNQITINGTDGNISGLKDNLPTPAAANQAAPANLTAIGNRAATVNDVLNAGWNLKAGGADKDFVKPYDTVDFVNGNATVAKVESDGSTSKVSYDVNVDGSTIKVDANGKLYATATGASSKVEALSGSPITVSGDGSTANPYKVGAATTSLVVGSRGSITAPAAADAGKLVNAGDLAAAINNSGFIATSAKTGSGQVSGSSEKLVKPGDTLKLTAGNGIKIAQQDGEFTISGTDTGSATLPNLKLTGNTGTAETDNIDPAQPYNIKGSDGNILTAVENQGIGFKLADTVKIGPAAGGNQITINGTDGNISGLKDNLPTPAAANQAAPANLTAIGNRAATVNDVLNAGWNLKAGGADKDFVKPYDTVDFVNGNATVAKVESDGSTSKVSYDVNVDGSTIKVDANGKLYATAAAASVPNIKLEGNSGTGETNNIDPTLPYTIKGTDGNVLTTVANQGIGFALNNIVNIGPATGGNRVTINGNAGTIGGLTNKTFDVNNIVSGQAATEDQLKAVAQQVARPSSFTLTAQGANGSTVTGGATVDLRSTDNNITVSKDATDNTVKFALAKNLTADSLTTGNTKVDNAGVTVNGGANGPVSLTNSGLNNGGNTITNVADGVNDTDAVNVRQLRNAQGSLTNVTNIIGTTAPNLVTYNVHGNEAKTDNTIVSAINNMNTGGIKFFHVNDGTGNQNTAGMTSHPEDSSAAGNYGAAVGYQAKADGENAIAFGKGAQASGANSISIGTGNQVSGSRSGAIGDPSVVTGNDAYSIGNNNVISTNNTFALGSNISTTSTNSVFLGDNSASFTQNGSGNNGVHTAVSGSSNYTYKGENDANVAGVNNAAGVVSVGNATSTRQIQGVAAGVIAADSTDAVNGSQLYYTNKAIESVKNGGAGIVQYSNANNPTQGGGAPSNNVTLVGADTNAPVTLHNVAPGVQGTDAVNVNQLNQVNNRINKVADDADAGTAAAMATAGLPQAYLPGKSMVAVAGSTYRGKQGYAVGFSAITDSGNWIIKGSASGNSKGRFGATVGAGYQW